MCGRRTSLITRCCVLFFALLLCLSVGQAQQPNQQSESDRLKEAVYKVLARERGRLTLYESPAKYPLRPGDRFTRFSITVDHPGEPQYIAPGEQLFASGQQVLEQARQTPQKTRQFSPGLNPPVYSLVRVTFLWQKMQVPIRRE